MSEVGASGAPEDVSTPQRPQRTSTVLLALTLTLAGGAVFVLGSPYYTAFPTNRNQAYNVGITVGFLVLALLLRRSGSAARYWKTAYSLFVASAATLFLTTGFFNMQNDTMPAAQLLAVDKLSQAMHVVPVIIALTLIARQPLADIFVSRGDLRQGLRFGAISFAGFAVAGAGIFAAFGVTLGEILPSIPWLLLWISANAIMEELWFRGIFLKRYEPLIGRRAAILVTSLIFGASHVGATYAFPGGGIVLGVITFAFGIVGAHWMLKTDSLVGPVLFHAGYDILIILPVLASV